MNTPKKTKRASGSIDPAKVTRPPLLTHPVSDEVAAYIGLIVTEYTRLEQRMCDVFRVILGIESGEAAKLAYNALRAAASRWDIARAVLEKGHGHIKTPASYDELIDRFDTITKFRNDCAHHIWEMDQNNQPWKSGTKTPDESLSPRKFRKSEFDETLTEMRKLYDDIKVVLGSDLRNLNRRWIGRAMQARGIRP